MVYERRQRPTEKPCKNISGRSKGNGRTMGERMIHITIPLAPVTKKNSLQLVSCGKYHKVLPSKKYMQYQADCMPFLKQLGIDYPVNIRAEYYMSTRRVVDLVNLHEALCDVLVHYGTLKDDNSRIVAAMDGSRVLYDKANPRTEVYIEKLEELGGTK
jgi:Holliday junction resolvase RusA-like endonuclease